MCQDPHRYVYLQLESRKVAVLHQHVAHKLRPWLLFSLSGVRCHQLPACFVGEAFLGAYMPVLEYMPRLWVSKHRKTIALGGSELMSKPIHSSDLKPELQLQHFLQIGPNRFRMPKDTLNRREEILLPQAGGCSSGGDSC